MTAGLAGPVRTLLYTPGDRPERYTRAWREGVADIVCADLEDAVRPDGKDAARSAVANALAETPRPRSLRAVRINPSGAPAHAADVAMVGAAKPDLVVLPKAERPAEVRRVLAALEGMPVLAILESARGILAGQEIAACGVSAIAFGAEDLAADVGMRRSAQHTEVATARQWTLLCAASAGIPALDMITPDYHDLPRIERDALEARRWGFAGKMCIHPNQVAPIHTAFTPTAEEMAWANRVLDAVARADVAAGGVIVVDGTMVDVPVIRQARRVAEMARHLQGEP